MRTYPLTVEEIKIMDERLHVAESVMRFFTDVKSIRSTTQVCDPGWLHEDNYQPQRCADNIIINQYRDDSSYDSHVSRGHFATSTGLGNCGEKSSIVYTSLLGNPILLRQKPFCHVNMCTLIGDDHAFVMITDFPIRPRSVTMHLGSTALIIDPWMMDIYFPNNSYYGAKYTPNKEQLELRRIISSTWLSPYHAPLMPRARLKYISSKSEDTKL